MKDISKKPLISLVDRLKSIDNEIKLLTDEYNNIINELWGRIPTLKNDEVFQQIEKPKVLRKK